MLAHGYFPIGAPIREHTNQTLCEHDIAHIAGFISNPKITKKKIFIKKFINIFFNLIYTHLQIHLSEPRNLSNILL